MRTFISYLLLIVLCVSMFMLPISAVTQPTLVVGDVDCNGTPDTTDAMLILQIITRKCLPPTAPDENASFEEKADWYYYKAKSVLGDVNNDGKLGSDDALLILKFVVGKVDGFAVDDATQLVRYHQLPAWPGDVQ